jgi:hypothetical protein
VTLLDGIVFARPDHKYASYDDFWRMVEAAGFPVVPFREVDPAGGLTYIFTPWNGEVADLLPQMREKRKHGRIIWWNLERDLADASEDERNQRLDKVIPPGPGGSAAALVDDIWVSDRTYAALDQRFRHVVLGGHPGFADVRSVLFRQPRYTATLYAYVWGRRQMIVDDIVRHGTALGPNAWTLEERAHMLSGSPIMVNTHQYDAARTGAPIRFAVAASYGMGLISEPIDDPFPLVRDVHYVECPTEGLGRYLADFTGRATVMGTAPALFDLLVDQHRFDREVRKACEAGDVA